VWIFHWVASGFDGSPKMAVSADELFDSDIGLAASRFSQ
jgi:hypothetical protein